jgi:hypothetical protein
MRGRLRLRLGPGGFRRVDPDREARRASRDEQGWQQRGALSTRAAEWPEARIVKAARRRRRRAAEAERRACKGRA